MTIMAKLIRMLLGTKPRVLVVNNSKSSRSLMSIILTDKGYCVDAVESADIARVMVQAKGYDLIVIDYGLEEGRVHEIVESVVDGRNSDAQIIMYTGTPVNEVAERLNGLRWRVNEIVHKTADNPLSDIVERVMQRNVAVN